MPEPFALTCDSCGEPMLPNLSQADADGCLWICIDPDCPELCAGELETEDLMEGGVPKALAARLVRLIDYYEDTIEELHAQGAGRGEEGADAGGGAAAPPLAGSRERAQADLAALRRQVRELRRRSALAAAAADQLSLEFFVSCHSNDFAAAQDARRALAAIAALCGTARHAAVDAEECLGGIASELPGMFTAGELSCPRSQYPLTRKGLPEGEETRLEEVTVQQDPAGLEAVALRLPGDVPDWRHRRLEEVVHAGSEHSDH